MTEDVAITAAIDGARALLATARASGLREAHVATADFECFIAFSAASANPMRAAPAVAPATADEVVSALHVATLVEVVPLHATVAAGDTVATLRVLDQEFPLTAPISGDVVITMAKVGDLLEYGAPVVGLSLRP